MKLLLTLFAVGAGFLLLSFLSFWLAVRPPRLTALLTPGNVNLPVEELVITTRDGLRLAAWLAPRPGAPAVVLLHGYPADKSDLLSIAATLHSRFTVLLVDLRYFGASEGQVTTLGYRERDDLRRVVDVLQGRGFGTVGVFGFSLGGAVALLAAAEEPRIRAVVAYAAFADLQTLGRELYAHFWVLREPLIVLMRVWARMFLGHDITRPSPAEAAARLRIPVMLIHSRADDQIPFSHAERLARALEANRAAEMAFVERARHGELSPALLQRVGDFFETHLSPAGAEPR